MAFVPRLTKPESGNPYYNTRGKGGYSDAIKGSPTDSGCDVLSNCVGYAYGRFNEIGGYGSCKYLRPVNAENFIQYANGLQIGQVPRLGSCMVWKRGATLSGSDGAGHVAIVEKIISETQIVTSESGWNSSAFWTKTRHKGDGNWGVGSGYTFLGFIYNPAVTEIFSSEAEANIKVDGYWGRGTTMRLQEIFGTPIDGEVSGQSEKYKDINSGLASGWVWQSIPSGSMLIKAMQKWAEMPAEEQDGLIGPKTIGAFQAKLGTPVDGVVSGPSQMVKALQEWANKQE